MQENINYAGDIFYEIELAEDFEVAEDDDIYSLEKVIAFDKEKDFYLVRLKQRVGPSVFDFFLWQSESQMLPRPL